MSSYDFSDDPSASSRAVLVWDIRSGNLALTVSHSTKGGDSDEKIAALPLDRSTLMDTAFFWRDQTRSDNRFGLDPSTAQKGEPHIRLSLLNPLTNSMGRMGAWSVDQELSITRAGDGTYQLTQLEGNGYLAIEAYYYPKYADEPDGRSESIARRSVAPTFQHDWWDEGGGRAAVDEESWNECTFPSPAVVRCSNRRKKGESWDTTTTQPNAL